MSTSRRRPPRSVGARAPVRRSILIVFSTRSSSRIGRNSISSRRSAGRLVADTPAFRQTNSRQSDLSVDGPGHCECFRHCGLYWAVSETPPPEASFRRGIGASAGGLEALVELLGAVPATGMAFIVVQHLDPKHESLLPEILTKKTTLAVSLATRRGAIEPDHVYVIPPDALLTVQEGLLELKPRTSVPERPFPVDLLFSSLAAAYGEGAIGIVLSGADADGSLGVREIKHAGGFTFAQQPESARYTMMPRHAIETGCVDHVRDGVIDRRFDLQQFDEIDVAVDHLRACLQRRRREMRDATLTAAAFLRNHAVPPFPAQPSAPARTVSASNS